MSIDWSDKHVRRQFKEALKRRFSTPDELDEFVDDGINESLIDFTGSGIPYKTIVFKLIKAVISKGKIDELFEVFCEEFPDDPVIVSLTEGNFIQSGGNEPKLTKEDIEALFSCLEGESSLVVSYITAAFIRAFKLVLKVNFQKVEPDYCLGGSLVPIQELCQKYDDRLLLLRFAELSVIELERNDIVPEVTQCLDTWIGEFKLAYQLTAYEAANDNNMMPHAFLLVSLKESGQESQNQKYVNVHSELYIQGQDNPVDSGFEVIKSGFDEVGLKLSGIIQQAELHLQAFEITDVTLELFLPCVHLEANVADLWEVLNEQGQARKFGLNRSYTIRSLERLWNKNTQMVLAQKWKTLQTCVENNQGCVEFLNHRDPPKPGVLEALLAQKTGLKLMAELPSDSADRTAVLYDIINSAVPIAFWVVESGECSDLEKEITTSFGKILDDQSLLNFAIFAQRWREQRAAPCSHVIPAIRLLCDCPERIPSLYDADDEDDQLVAF